MASSCMPSNDKHNVKSSDSARKWTVLRPVEPEVLQRMLLYKSSSAYYLLGYNGEETQCRLLIFSRTTDHGRLSVVEDPRKLSPRQAADLLEDIHSEDSLNGGGLHLLCEAFGILGCFRFLEGYYLFLITKRKPLGSITGHTVYGIADTTLIPLSPSNDSWSERRYRKLLLSGVDLTKDFFFSYTYNLSYTVQHNLTHQEKLDPFECIFVWNEYLTRDLRTALHDNKWVLPLIHGSWQQRKLSIFGKLVTITLISRRSRRFAGPRYLKRGINQQGWVANEVETEQIINLHQKSQSGIPSLASVVQLRGSIPLFWGQGTSALNPRPAIMLYNMDPLYAATAKHFEDLFDRYGGPVVVLNLVKSLEKHPRETILRQEFGKAIAFLNEHVFHGDIAYIPWDYKEKTRKNGLGLLKEVEPMVRSCLQCTGFCAVRPVNQRLAASSPNSEETKPTLQQGVLRSNCIDCLDRTNICQYVYGLMALGYQLCALGLLATNEIDPNCSLAYQLMEMYEIMGNVLALQYGGSQAHGKFFDRMRGHSEAATKSREVLTSIKRYYSNAISDPEKQDAINLFLGNFIPSNDKPALWELESDYFMHCGVDWEVNKSDFTSSHHRSRTSISVSSSDNQSSSLLKRSSTRNLSSLQIFPVPVISQTGDPELPSSEEQTNKKDHVNRWGLKFWFGSKKDTSVDFKLPENKGPSLESFEEMLKSNPVIEVRLHDGVKGSQRGAMQKYFSKISKQEDLTDQTSRTDLDILSESSIWLQSRSSSMTAHARSTIQALQERPQHPVIAQKESDCLKVGEQNLNINSEEFNSLQNRSTFGLVDERVLTSGPTLPKIECRSNPPERAARRTWFGGLSRASTGSQQKKKTEMSGAGPKAMTHRAASTPAEVGAGIHDKDFTSLLTQRSENGKLTTATSNPIEDFWDQYWSITEQTLSSELTIAERISNAENKTEALRLLKKQQQQNYSYSYHHQQEEQQSHLNNFSKRKVKDQGNNLFLDDLIDQLLDKKEPDQEGTAFTQETHMDDHSKKTRSAASRMENNKVVGCLTENNKDLKKKLHSGIETFDNEHSLKLNINGLLYSTSSTGPGDRVLEKWFLADKKAETDYLKKLSWIASSVNEVSLSHKQIKA